MKLPNKSQQKLLDELIRRRFLQVKTDPVLLYLHQACAPRPLPMISEPVPGRSQI
jgi:hypothetical protein